MPVIVDATSQNIRSRAACTADALEWYSAVVWRACNISDAAEVSMRSGQRTGNHRT